MALVKRARAAGLLAISLLMLSAPGAMAGFPYSQPDAQIRLASSGYEGTNILNTTGLGQSVFDSGVVGQKLNFFIGIENIGGVPGGFKVKRSGRFNNGYRVRYYNDSGADVTGQVNVGSFTTPSLDYGEHYVMRATVKVRSLATLCSFVTRLMTVTSVNNSNARDSVRFTAALATPDLNCAPVAFNDKASITENTANVSGNLLANDIDPDGDALQVFGLAGGLYASLNISPNGEYSYGPLDNANPAVDGLNDGDVLIDVIPYGITDGNGGVSTTGTLTVTIHGVTDPD